MRSRRTAMSLIELLVVLGILGLLFAMLLPAIQHARAAARRVQCVNNLKQIGLSCQNFASAHGAFPSEHTESYERIERGMGTGGREQFRCPADSWSFNADSCRSYLLNSGTNFRRSDDYRNGFHLQFRPRKPSEISDGQSATAALAERLAIPVAPEDAAMVEDNPERFLWWTARVVPRVDDGEGGFIETCRHERTAVTPKWSFIPDTVGNGYDHFLTPNQFGCWNGPFEEADRHEVIVPASSLHSGGVNVLFVDGHVSFVSDGIDWAAWQALGTVDEHDAAGEGF